MRQHNKSSLFLMELIIAILFFGLASALCIQMFVKAKIMNESSFIESQAAMKASSIAETFRSSQLDEFYQSSEDGYVYFDHDWNQVDTLNAPFKAKIQRDNDTLYIVMYHEKEEIFKLDVKHYQQRKIGE